MLGIGCWDQPETQKSSRVCRRSQKRRVTQQNKPSPVDILNCYFGTLGDCPALVTGAWYTKPCFPHARRNYLCPSAYGRSCRGRSPIAASSTARLLMYPEGPSGTRGNAQVLGTPLPSRSTSLLVKKGYGTSTDPHYQSWFLLRSQPRSIIWVIPQGLGGWGGMKARLAHHLL